MLKQLLALFLLVSLSFALTNFNACTTMSTPNEVYNLTAGFTASGANCLSVTADNVTIEGNGNTIAASTFNTLVTCSNGARYTAQNLVTKGYMIGYTICNDTTFINDTMKDVSLTGAAATPFSMVTGASGFKLNMSNILVTNLTLSRTGTPSVISVGIVSNSCSTSSATPCTVTLLSPASTTLNNVTMQHISVSETTATFWAGSVGIFSAAAISSSTGIPTANQGISNVNAAQIAFNDINVTTNQVGAGIGQSVGVFSIVGASTGGVASISNLTLSNILVSNISLSNIKLSGSTAASDVENIFGVVADKDAEGVGVFSITNMTVLNLTTSAITLTGRNDANGILATMDEVTLGKSLVGSKTAVVNGFNAWHSFNTTNPNTQYIYSDGFQGGSTSTSKVQFTNFNATINYNSSLTSTYVLNLTSTTAPAKKILFSNITFPAPPGSEGDELSYFNYTFETAPQNNSLYYTAPSLPFTDSASNVWNYTSSWAKLASSGTVDTVNKIFYMNIANVGTTAFIGLFADSGDSDAPIPVLSSPPNGSVSSNTSQLLSFTATDANDAIFACSFALDGSVLSTNSSVSNNTATSFLATSLGQGVHNWNVNCTDAASNANTSGNFTFTVITSAPVVTLVTPTNGTIFYPVPANVTFNFTTSSASSTLNCSLILDNALQSTNATATSNATTLFTLSNISIAAHSWFVSCTDLAANIGNSSTYQFTIQDSSSGSGNSGGPGPGLPSTPIQPPPAPSESPAPPPPSTEILAASETQGVLATAIVATSGGQIQTQSYQCEPRFSNICGPGVLLDDLLCEYYAFLSLYIVKLTAFANFALFTLFLTIFAFSQTGEHQSKTKAVLIAFFIGTFVIGFNFLYFGLTALIIALSGGKVA